mmetsp:Transcript_2630/g.6220  ORF Transcript_2630/g.6220 Transcript_2630/m.6220 type:complete len:209 (-) Transcript_2630:2114-2740(-)
MPQVPLRLILRQVQFQNSLLPRVHRTRLLQHLLLMQAHQIVQSQKRKMMHHLQRLTPRAAAAGGGLATFSREENLTMEVSMKREMEINLTNCPGLNKLQRTEIIHRVINFLLRRRHLLLLPISSSNNNSNNDKINHNLARGKFKDRHTIHGCSSNSNLLLRISNKYNIKINGVSKIKDINTRRINNSRRKGKINRDKGSNNKSKNRYS